jgi:hypothetical protein
MMSRCKKTCDAFDFMPLPEEAPAERVDASIIEKRDNMNRQLTPPESMDTATTGESPENET